MKVVFFVHFGSMGMARTCASYAAMVVVILGFGSSNILAKIALEKGLSQFVFVAYRHMIAVIVLAPFAYAFERKHRPSMSTRLLMKIFVLSALGTSIHQNLYFLGLDYTSPTVALALSNVNPSLTFLLAVLFRMEKISIRSVKSQAKIIGTVICIGGALVFTFWRGYLFPAFVKHPLIDIYGIRSPPAAATNSGLRHHHKHGWVTGSALIVTSHALWSAWLIFQAAICKVYTAQLSLNTLICFFALLQSSVIAIIFERNPTAWKLGWDVQLLSVVYCGVVVSGLVYYLQTWCITEKGPFFVAMFTPLAVVFVAIFSAIVFAERLHLGSLIGASLILIGLYIVLWGKSESNNNGGKGDLSSETNKNSPDNQKLEISATNNEFRTVHVTSDST